MNNIKHSFKTFYQNLNCKVKRDSNSSEWMASLLTTATTTPAPLDLCKKTLDSGRKSYEDCFQLTSPLKIRVTLFYLLAYLDFYFVTTWKYFETIFTFNTKIFTSELFLPLEATVVKKARSFSNAEKVHFLQNKLVDLFANIVEHLWPRSMIGNSDSSDILLAIF